MTKAVCMCVPYIRYLEQCRGSAVGHDLEGLGDPADLDLDHRGLAGRVCMHHACMWVGRAQGLRVGRQWVWQVGSLVMQAGFRAAGFRARVLGSRVQGRGLPAGWRLARKVGSGLGK